MAGSWANIAASKAEKPVESGLGSTQLEVEPGAKYAVLDANAIIGGNSISQFGEKLLTTQEVYNEIQDRQSKNVLESVLVGLVIQEPTAASVSAGKAASLLSKTSYERVH